MVSFNQPIDNLPDSLTHLTFSYCFNQPIDNLPDSLTHLSFGDNFNQTVDKLPNSITHLTFGKKFDQSVDNLPNTITHLTLGDYKKNVDKLKSSLVELSFTNLNKIKDNIPDFIKTIAIYFDKNVDENVTNIPCWITTIKINDPTKKYFISKIPFNCKLMDLKGNLILNY